MLKTAENQGFCFQTINKPAYSREKVDDTERESVTKREKVRPAEQSKKTKFVQPNNRKRQSSSSRTIEKDKVRPAEQSNETALKSLEEVIWTHA